LGRDLSRIEEHNFERVYLDLLLDNGWSIFKDNDPRKNERGFPDISAVYDAEDLFIWLVTELKTTTGRLRPEQKPWYHVGTRITNLGGHFIYRLWTPYDWEEMKCLAQNRIWKPIAS
jgi:hypothetical protein